MTANWNLYYKQNDDGAMQFAELIIRDGMCSVRTGAVFTHGTVTPVDSFHATSEQLVQDGYELQRSWHFDRNNRDYGLLEQEIKAVVSTAADFSESNALALITDSGFMTIGFALQKFDDIESTDDELLWIVDEWGEWDEDWNLDPAYRWLLAYGFHDQLDSEQHREFCDHVRLAFQAILKSFADSKEILLIYIGGDDVGHKWSADCMNEELATRMLNWI